ncbi:putative acetyl-CoA synthetase [Desulfosarcina variabilis str. Montpellier]|uniref:bifunctional acetate--CoA ligase family protein/GNAT family N-acetyltransferase n=1 Tax=Desulfosarcina variabilis TaxID=2300 RepID=UPI003AFA0B63
MSIYHLDKLLKPKSVAVIGASKKKGSLGELVVRNLQSLDFEGTILPVNPNYNSIYGLPCRQRVDELEPDIDLAVIATPIHTVPSILNACAENKIQSALVVADTRREIGEKRHVIEAEISRIVANSGIRVIGPNSVGLINTAAGLNISFASAMPNRGKLAFISQSSSIYTSALDMALLEQIGFSYYISAGSMADVDFGDLVDYFGNDKAVGSILLYLEQLKNPRKFLSAARAVSHFKPIVVWRPEQSMAGRHNTMADTAIEDIHGAVYDAAFDRAGIVSVSSIDELFNCAKLMAQQPRPRGKNLVVINNGSAPGLQTATAMVRCHMQPMALRPETMEALDRVLPPYWNRNNPINMLSGTDAKSYVGAVSACLNDKSVNGLLITMAPEAAISPTEVARRLVQTVKGARIPILASWYGGRDMEEGKALFNAAGIPTFRTPEKAIQAFSHLLEYNRNQEMRLEVPDKLNRGLNFNQEVAQTVLKKHDAHESSFLNIWEIKELLEAYGIPFVSTHPVKDEQEAIAAAETIGYPVAMKKQSIDASSFELTDGIELGLRTPADVHYALARMMADNNKTQPDDPAPPGVILQPYITRADYKLIFAIKKDPQFGPVLLFGMGGVLSLVFDKPSVGLPPLNRLLARRMMENSRASHLLRGYRNRPAADMEKLEEMLIRLAQISVDFPQIDQLLINPVIIKNGKVLALDAQIKLTSTRILSPKHLVISPYPKHQERIATTKDGRPLFIRPVRPEDVPLFVTFRESLSESSLYYRFFRNISEFTPRQLHLFTTIDYDREIALIALANIDKEEKMLGVIRILSHPDRKKGDFYIIVADAMQGQGIGSILLHTALDIARKQGYETIFGVVLPENEGMKNLSKKVGFQVKFNFDERVFDLRLDLDTHSDA